MNAVIDEKQTAKRLDLRDLPIFTIDGADTKDIDDAISIERTEGGYKLGVHIADVSHYVTEGSPLDNDAFERGTSVYIADKVIPMLPKELSNGICSLNPGVDRLAFSCLMEISDKGTVKKYKFAKTVIRSRVQGVYSEVNSILDGTANAQIKRKYKDVIDCIPVMNELAQILIKKRKDRGAPDIKSSESKVICDENGICIDIKPRIQCVSEGIIEEFMLMANNSAAKVGMKKEIPFVYRVHENPPAEKIESLKTTLEALGINPLGINEKAEAKNFAKLLEETADDPKNIIINRIVLRTMAKAKYSEQPIGHFGLVMKEYAHFTSPIRRYADLSIHRILTDYVSRKGADKLKKKYGDQVVTLTLKDQYYNMRKIVEPHPQVIDKALKAMEMAGVKPLVRPIRGGTDGARLSFMGLPCPNLFTGGMNFHGKFEYCSLTTMRKAQQVILNLAVLWSE